MMNKPSDKDQIVELLNYFFDTSESDDSDQKDESPDTEYNEIKLAIIGSVESFLRKPNMKELLFPLSFTPTEHRLVKAVADKLGLNYRITKKTKHQSMVAIYKHDIASIFKEPFPLNITWNSRRAINQILISNPLTVKEKQEIQQKTDKGDMRDDRHRGTTGKLMGAVPQIPISKVITMESNFLPEGQQSPVWKMESEIIEAIKQNPVVIIFSSAGCGKTTKIAQMVMQDCGKAGEPCRMICTQPYRLTAHANAQFVTQQRKENIGQTVGYQIRLESKVSPRTLLTFCTNEVLLRTLYGDRAFLNGTTHIIIDELQERCKHSDLLLAALKKMQKTHQHLKIIILITIPALPCDIVYSSILDPKNSYYYRHLNMKAAMGCDHYFVNNIRHYLDYCPVIYVRQSVQDIEELFLDDILKIIDCKLENIDQNRYLFKVDLYKLTFEKWLSCWTFKSKPMDSLDLSLFELFYKNANPQLYAAPNSNLLNSNFIGQTCFAGNSTMKNDYSNHVDYLALYDEILWSLWSRQEIGDICGDSFLDYDSPDSSNVSKGDGNSGNNNIGGNSFKMLFSIITDGYVSVNYQHRMSGLSALMICAFRGFKNGLKMLLTLGADVAMPLVVTDTIFQAFKSFLNHLQSTQQVNNTILLFYEIFASRHNHIGTMNVLYASDLALMTRSFEASEILFGRVACDAEATFSYSDQPPKGNLLNRPTSLLANHGLLFKIIFGILEILDKNMERGTILIFLPDYNYLIKLKSLLLLNAPEIFGDYNRYQIYLLHSRMMIQDLNSLLFQNVGNYRKIILSSSIGESSMHVGDVSFVIDSGLESKRVYDEMFGVSTFKTIPISKSQVALRATRANNGNNRICFHLFTLEQYEAMSDQKVPEILTSPLNEVILQMKLLTPSGVPIDQFMGSMIDSPSVESMRNSMTLLRSIEALDGSDEITELGYHLYDLPLDPKYGKMVVSSVILKCLDPILTISCILNYQDPFVTVTCGQAARDLYDVKRKFAANTFSDHIVLLRAFQFWQKARAEGWESTFCQKNFLSSAVFEIVIGIRTRLLGQLRASGFVKARGNGDIRDLNYNSENWAVVKAAIVSGLSDNYVHYNSENAVLVSSSNAKVLSHPSSTLHSCNSSSSIISANHSTNMFIYDKAFSVPHVSNNNWWSYDSVMTSSKTTYVSYITMVTPITVALLGSNVNISQSNNDNQNSTRMRRTDNIECPTENIQQREFSIEFKADEESAQLLLKLRQKWQSLVLRKLKNPAKQYTPQDETLLRAIVNVLTLEEQHFGLKQPSGVGARPRPMAPESCNQNDLNSDSKTNLPFHKKCTADCQRTQEPFVMKSANNEYESSSNGWLSKAMVVENKDNSIPYLDLSENGKMLNNDSNHFFIIKLLHEDELCGIIESKIYKVNFGLKLQIENLLVSGFNIYFIFINGGSNATLGYAKILQIVAPEFPDVKGNEEGLFPKDFRNQTFSLILDVFPDKLEVGVNDLMLDFLRRSVPHDAFYKESPTTLSKLDSQTSHNVSKFATSTMPASTSDNNFGKLKNTSDSFPLSYPTIGHVLNVVPGQYTPPVSDGGQMGPTLTNNHNIFMMAQIQNSNLYLK